ncbi:hypothetical protein COOONC_01681, partial [Cooperia oncophora]
MLNGAEDFYCAENINHFDAKSILPGGLFHLPALSDTTTAVRCKGIAGMPLWIACLVVWCISLVLITIGIWMNKVILFVPAYAVWVATFILSVLFIAIDIYADLFCGKPSGNKTSNLLLERASRVCLRLNGFFIGHWSSPCDTLIRRKG